MKHPALLMSVLLASLVIVFSGCGPGEQKEAAPRPRPVTVLKLASIDPVRPLQITGSVKSWKEQDVSFEVSGRVAFIVQQGTNLVGRWKEDQQVRVQGDALARVDQREYRISREVAAAGLDVADKQLARAEIELEKVLPANLKAAKAEKDRAAAEFLRYKKAREANTVSEVDFIRATADRDARQARYEQAEAAFDTQRAEIASRQANVKEASEKLGNADYNLERCTVYAPFDGEVSEIYVEAGGYVQAGQAVAHLVMMNPIKVDIAVAGETASRLNYGDNVKVFIPGRKEPHRAVVYEKGTIADAKTRTFRISIITRNERILAGLPSDDPRFEHPRIPGGKFLMRLRSGGIDTGPLMVEEKRSLRKDAEGYYVWGASDVKMGEQNLHGRTITLKKYRIKVGDTRRNYQGIYLFREVTDAGGLPVHSFVAEDVPDDFADGGKVVVARKEWLLRPGALVQVYLGIKAPARGLYVPMDALKPIDDRTAYAFVLHDGKARRVKVNLVATAGELFRIAAADAKDAELLVPGAQIVADNIHFLQDGEPIQAVRVVETSR